MCSSGEFKVQILGYRGILISEDTFQEQAFCVPLGKLLKSGAWCSLKVLSILISLGTFSVFWPEVFILTSFGMTTSCSPQKNVSFPRTCLWSLPSVPSLKVILKDKLLSPTQSLPSVIQLCCHWVSASLGHRSCLHCLSYHSQVPCTCLLNEYIAFLRSLKALNLVLIRRNNLHIILDISPPPFSHTFFFVLFLFLKPRGSVTWFACTTCLPSRVITWHCGFHWKPDSAERLVCSPQHRHLKNSSLARTEISFILSNWLSNFLSGVGRV